MVPSKSRARCVIASLTLALAFALPGVASAATLPAAAATPYNSTPDCPVSATDPVCSWNVPADAANIFSALDYGECPYWAAEKYPALVLDELASDPLGTDWNGSTWVEHAASEGLPVSSAPAAGDLAVWQAEPGDIAGHVAYVEAVDGSAIIVSQMDGNSDAPFPAMQGTTEYIDSANLTYFADAYGLQFVQTGDPSTTPLSYVEQVVSAVTEPTGSASSASSDRTTATADSPAAETAQTNVVVKAKTVKPKVHRKRAVRKRVVRKRVHRKTAAQIRAAKARARAAKQKASRSAAKPA